MRIAFVFASRLVRSGIYRRRFGCWRRLFIASERLGVKRRGIPHLAKNERDTPNFLHGALDTAACAPFFKERRIKFAEPNKARQEIGILGTLSFAWELSESIRKRSFSSHVRLGERGAPVLV